MSRIFGEKETIEAAQKAGPGDKTVYINWDAIRELPDEYEVVISKVEYNPKNLEIDFSPVGNGFYMPQPQLMYRIAEAKGIRGGEKSISEPIIEDTDINPMMCKGIETPPQFRKMIVGRRVRKYSLVLEEDGTERRSSICTSEYNVWERCLELWSKEEEQTENYSPQKIKSYPNGKKYIEVTYYDKAAKTENTFKADLKYDTPFKRRAHFQAEMKFAHAKAETKAHEKTIRELAGLMTGYKEEDLKTGRLYFARVRRSREILKAESAARLSAISQGKQIESNVSGLLFGPEDETPVHKMEPQEFPPMAEEKPPELVKTKREQYIAAIDHYRNENLIPADAKESVELACKWLVGDKNAEQKENYWKRAVDILRALEKAIPPIGLYEHTIY